ncbi:MAG TPA: AAA family ATPase [Polyangiaceae bacterium]|jgi:5'-3' exonuclease|nr:AAA family ATPase [Polyangiaceae bacterium]
MLTLIDLSGIFWPCYYSAQSGSEAYHLTMSQILGITESCERTIVCAEGRRPIRFDWAPDYKANRPEKPAEAKEALVQIIAEVCDMGIPLVSIDGYEADDLIATFATQAREPVQIVSIDKDLAALLSDSVSMVINGTPFGPAECLTKFGVRPDQIRDFLAITGDSADNIKGCPGLGAKRAAAMLKKFGTLQTAQAATDDELGLGEKTLANFRAWDPSLALKLVTLLKNAPIHLNDIFKDNDPMADMTKIVAERTSTAIKVLIYGTEGAGKTRFGAFAPKPIFICAENGLIAPDLRSVPAFPSPDTWDDVLSAIDYLKTADHQYKTLVIDSLDWLSQYAKASVCAREKMSPADYDSYGRGEKFVFDLWVQLISALDSLQAARGMHVVTIAHATNETVQNPLGDDYARFQLALAKKAAERWKQWPDYLLFMSQEMFTKKGKDDKTAKGIIGGHRIYTERSAGFDAKNRINLPAEIEYETVNPWRNFAMAVKQITAPQAPAPTAPANNAPKQENAA